MKKLILSILFLLLLSEVGICADQGYLARMAENKRVAWADLEFRREMKKLELKHRIYAEELRLKNSDNVNIASNTNKTIIKSKNVKE